MEVTDYALVDVFNDSEMIQAGVFYSCKVLDVEINSVYEISLHWKIMEKVVSSSMGGGVDRNAQLCLAPAIKLQLD